MAYNISDLDGNVNAPSADYPDGSMADSSPAGAGNGTRVNRKMIEDVFQTFLKIAREAGTTLNGQPDNETNDYQFYDSLISVINATVDVNTSVIDLQNDKANKDQGAWVQLDPATSPQSSDVSNSMIRVTEWGEVQLAGTATNTGTGPDEVVVVYGVVPVAFRPTRNITFVANSTDFNIIIGTNGIILSSLNAPSTIDLEQLRWFI